MNLRIIKRYVYDPAGDPGHLSMPGRCVQVLQSQDNASAAWVDVPIVNDDESEKKMKDQKASDDAKKSSQAVL